MVVPVGSHHQSHPDRYHTHYHLSKIFHNNIITLDQAAAPLSCCNSCGEESDDKLTLCTRYRDVYYCSVSCQKQDWADADQLKSLIPFLSHNPRLGEIVIRSNIGYSGINVLCCRVGPLRRCS